MRELRNVQYTLLNCTFSDYFTVREVPKFSVQYEFTLPET